MDDKIAFKLCLYIYTGCYYYLDFNQLNTLMNTCLDAYNKLNNKGDDNREENLFTGCLNFKCMHTVHTKSNGKQFNCQG